MRRERTTSEARRRWVTIALAVAITATVVAPAAVWASDRFTDVPDSNIFHDDITWLADAGVTLGCNPPSNDRYCPSDNVTREQMAAFMRRLAENRVVDAGTLNGKGANQYSTLIEGAACVAGDCPDAPAAGEIVAVLQTTINAPIGGGVLDIDYSFATSLLSPAADLIQTWVTVDTSTDCGGWFFIPTEATPGTYANVMLDTGVTLGTTAGSTVVNVGQGNHTVTVCAFSLDQVNSDQAGLSVTWSAQGTGVPLTAAAVSDAELERMKGLLGTDVPRIDG